MLDQSTLKEQSDRAPSTEPSPRPHQEPGSHPSITATNVQHTKWSYLGFVYASSEGFVVRFGIDQERYLLKLTQPNYNAMFSVLLGCWLNRGKLSIEYKTRVATGSDSNEPFVVEGVNALPPGSEGT